MRLRFNWKLALVLILVGASISAGLYFAYQELDRRADELLITAWQESNPDVPTKAAWHAMSWEEKQACKIKFEQGYHRRQFRSARLTIFAAMSQVGIGITVLVLLLVIAENCIKTEATCDSAAP